MKILLLGEYSNMHWTLAQGLRQLGCEVTVVSDGDSYKNYQRDITLKRDGYGYLPSIKYIAQLWLQFQTFKGYDVVQIVNPCFFDVKAERNLQLFNFLKKHNKKVFLGAFGDDTYWVKTCLSKNVFRYSEFDIPNRTEPLVKAAQLEKSWIGTAREEVNREIAENCDGIIACLYEYYKSYELDFKNKLVYIPQPINLSTTEFRQRGTNPDLVNFFIGIQVKRSDIKGADVLLKVLQDVHKKYPTESSVQIAESVPYQQYMQMRDKTDVLLDQLYSYSPAMNALGAMAQGIVTVSGGEPKVYEQLGEMDNHPIVNVYPTESDIFEKLESLIINRKDIAELSLNSRRFVEKHHDHVNVAQQYLDFWNR